MEWLLALASLLGLYALSHGKRWGWLLSTAGSLGYALFFWGKDLFGLAGLNLIYAATQLYGWRGESRFHSRPRALLWMLAALPLALGLQRYTGPADAWLTAPALLAQLLTAAKVGQVWRVWLVLDLASAGYFAAQGWWGTAGLYLVLAAVAESAHRAWQGGPA